MKKLIKIVPIVVVALLLALVILVNCIAVVPVGSTGILLTLGRVEDDKALAEGMHLKIPFIQKIVSMDNRVKKLEIPPFSERDKTVCKIG